MVAAMAVDQVCQGPSRCSLNGIDSSGDMRLFEVIFERPLSSDILSMLHVVAKTW